MLIVAFLTIHQMSGVVALPPGVTELDAPLVIPKGARGLTVSGSKSILRASPAFQGAALIVVRDGAGIRIQGVTLDGNRKLLAKPIGLPPHDRTFASFYANNGILAERVEGLSIADVKISEVANFAILISSSRDVRVERAQVSESGSLNALRRNNTTGGILIEEGTVNFAVEGCAIREVLGNGIWTHSNYTSPRNGPGRILSNTFSRIGRDAIQVGHASEIRVERNSGSAIGEPNDIVDVEGGGTPVAIDTAGNVDKSSYTRNRFININGKCIDLDGFHDGEVSYNTCVNSGPPGKYPYGHYGIVFNNTNPDMRSQNVRVFENVMEGMKFGGIFVIGSGHTITRNRLLRVNTAGCNESHAKFGCIFDASQPELLQSGIYLGSRAERPAVTHDNVIRDNVITGHRMRERCIAFGPGVSRAANTVERNTCRSMR